VSCKNPCFPLSTHYISKVHRLIVGSYLIAVFLDLFKKHQHDGRIVLPLLRTLDMLMNRRCLGGLVNERSFRASLLERLWKESNSCKDIKCLVAIVSVSTGLISYAKTNKEALALVCNFLDHKFPCIRSLAAEKLYVHLLETDLELKKEHAAIRILLKNNWEMDPSGTEKVNRDEQIREIMKVFEIKNDVLVFQS